MRGSAFAAKLFAATGVVFMVASLIVPRDAAHALDVWVGDTPHAVHLYWIAAAICYFWSAVYYAMDVLLHLRLRLVLSLFHFAVTLALLIGRSAIHYAGFTAKPHAAQGAWLAVVVVPHAAASAAISLGLFILILTWSLVDRARQNRA